MPLIIILILITTLIINGGNADHINSDCDPLHKHQSQSLKIEDRWLQESSGYQASDRNLTVVKKIRTVSGVFSELVVIEKGYFSNWN
jgi:hypothetical protein